MSGKVSRRSFLSATGVAVIAAPFAVASGNPEPQPQEPVYHPIRQIGGSRTYRTPSGEYTISWDGPCEAWIEAMKPLKPFKGTNRFRGGWSPDFEWVSGWESLPRGGWIEW